MCGPQLYPDHAIGLGFATSTPVMLSSIGCGATFCLICVCVYVHSYVLADIIEPKLQKSMAICVHAQYGKTLGYVVKPLAPCIHLTSAGLARMDIFRITL
jgi:hypothetical protein